MQPEIFREYDIRGLVATQLTPDVARRIGRAIGTYLQRHHGRRVALGRDVRPSSPELSAAIAEGLVSTGAEVMDVGLVPTPALYFAIHEFGADGGVMVTGSHNPPEFNGIKVNGGTGSLYGAAIQEIRGIAESGEFAAGRGSAGTREILARYEDRLVEGIRLRRPVKVVADAGNGTAGLVAPSAMRRIGAEVIPLYCEPDGRFPNHHPDPTVPAYLRDLIGAVKENRADLGIAFDGDADRIGVVDERGEILFGDRLLALYARDVLRGGPAKVVLEVKCSMALVDDIAARGGTPIMWKAGHSLIKQKMREENAPLGGEMSGHMFFADRYFGFDDAPYAALRTLEILAAQAGPMSGLLADLPRYPSTPELRVDCPDDVKFGIVDRIRAHFASRREVIDVDGVRVLFPEGWALVRASNTQPVLVVRFEAKSEAALAALRGEVEEHLARYPQVGRIPGDSAPPRH